MIDKDTKIYGSFSKNPGNLGCEFFNYHFQRLNINAIYKSFYTDDMRMAVTSATTLGFGGFAISSPYKTDPCLLSLGRNDLSVKLSSAVNTVVITNGFYSTYNTDYMAAKKLIPDVPEVIIIGGGGLARAVQAACLSKLISFRSLYRDDMLGELELDKDVPVINCTPVEFILPVNTYLDCRVETEFGKKFHTIQASEQFRLYTGIKI